MHVYIYIQLYTHATEGSRRVHEYMCNTPPQITEQYECMSTACAHDNTHNTHTPVHTQLNSVTKHDTLKIPYM